MGKVFVDVGLSLDGFVDRERLSIELAGVADSPHVTHLRYRVRRR